MSARDSASIESRGARHLSAAGCCGPRSEGNTPELGNLPNIFMSDPEILVVIPARNEAPRLPRCLAALRSSALTAGVKLHVVVVENRSTDRTAAVARELGCHVVQSEAKNLAAIRNVGVRSSDHDLVVTVDADSLVSRRFFERVWQICQDPQVVGGGVLIFPERWSLGIVVTGVFLGTLAVFYRISGGAFFFRRDAFEAIGGFAEQVVSAEDIDFARRMRRHARRSGGRFVNLLTAWIVTSCRKFDTFGDWYLVRHPLEAWRLLRGRDQKLADKFWYDYVNRSGDSEADRP
jgi:glycosyltransferase involved in cell wall biosynthesis